MKISVEIAKECLKWKKYPEINKKMLSSIAKEILAMYPNLLEVSEWELSVLLTDDDKIQELNKEFREKNKPTNVLSFPDLEITWLNILEFTPNADYMYLGDVAFSYQVIENEAIENEVSFQDHFKHLFIHAILHLLGYDHIDDDEAEIMESLEIKILNKLNIPNPYLTK